MVPWFIKARGNILKNKIVFLKHHRADYHIIYLKGNNKPKPKLSYFNLEERAIIKLISYHLSPGKRCEILKRSKGSCRCCNCDLDLMDRWEVHHILPIVFGGDDSLKNLSAICIDCHKAISAATKGLPHTNDECVCRNGCSF